MEQGGQSYQQPNTYRSSYARMHLQTTSHNRMWYAPHTHTHTHTRTHARTHAHTHTHTHTHTRTYIHTCAYNTHNQSRQCKLTPGPKLSQEGNREQHTQPRPRGMCMTKELMSQRPLEVHCVQWGTSMGQISAFSVPPPNQDTGHIPPA